MKQKNTFFPLSTLRANFKFYIILIQIRDILTYENEFLFRQRTNTF